MATVKQVVGSRTAQSSGIATLVNGSYTATSSISTTTNQPVDVVVEVEAATTGAVASPFQLSVFLQESLDGTNFRSGPVSGSTTTDEPDLLLLGTIPMNTNTTTHRGSFSIFQALGYVPAAYKVVVKNGAGAALTSGGIYTTEISQTVA